jgi:hypothetical protein
MKLPMRFISRTLLPTLLIVCASSPIFASQLPPSQTELNGYILRQRKVVLQKLGKPIEEEKYPDGWLALAYTVDEKTHSYMAFKFSKEEPDQIRSIQIAGDKGTPMRAFLGLRLGDSKERVTQVLGAPNESKHESDVNVDLLSFKDRNYSVEINAAGEVSSIQIMGYDGFPDKITKPIPSLDEFAAAVVKRDKEALLQWVHPDLEIYKGKDVVNFSENAWNEINNPNSPVTAALIGETQSLRSVFISEKLKGDPEIRIYTKVAPGSVLKFPTSKILREVVFEFFAGEWRVYEIQLR